MIKIDSGCTPNHIITLDLDPNPNGLPVVWLAVIDNHTKDDKYRANVPMNREAVSLMLVELSKLIGWM